MFRITLILFTTVIFIVSPFFGATDIEIANILNPSTIDYQIFWELRMPRVALAFFTGSALALSGLLFQTIFRNPLTTPFTLGVSSGATLGAAIAIKFNLVVTFFAFSSVSLFGFTGAVATILILFLFAKKLHSFAKDSLLLLGIALSFFYSSAIYILYYLSSFVETHSIIRFTLGSLSIVGVDELIPVVVSTLFLLFIALFFSRELKLLSISYENAYLKGIDIKKINMIILFFVSITIGIVVSITGPIGFVGLIIPHMIRKIIKKGVDELIIPVFFAGGVFLLFCDIFSRTITMPSEVPIGIITSFIGGPFFIYLILSRQRD